MFKIYYERDGITVYHGDCREVLPTLNGIHACVTDPPYGLKFMGKAWDYDVPSVEIWKLVLAALKPGAHLLSFAGTRTHHRMAINIEDAGFEIRDMLAYIYGSGFPKNLDISKAIDKAAGAEREVVGEWNMPGRGKRNEEQKYGLTNDNGYITAPATDAAKKWAGFGTALKPAMEPITVARRPLEGTVAENIIEHGTGALNIDASRVGTTDDCARQPSTLKQGAIGYLRNDAPMFGGRGHAYGRWPANLILSYPEDEYALRDNVTPDQLHKLAEWMNENQRKNL